MGYRVSATKTIGRYKLEARDYDSTFGNDVYLYDMGKYIKHHNYTSSKYNAGTDAINQFLIDEWSYFFDTKPIEKIYPCTTSNYIYLHENNNESTYGYYEFVDFFNYIINYYDYSFGNYIKYETVTLNTFNTLTRLDLDPSSYDIDEFYVFYFEKGIAIALLENHGTVRNRLFSRDIKDGLKNIPFSFPSYKSSVYDTRIQTDCCLLVLCEPTKYKL